MGGRTLLGLGSLLSAGGLLLALPAIGAADTGPSAPLWASLALEAIWVLVALGIALVADAAPVSDRLALGPSRLSLAAGGLAVVGLLCTSSGAHQVLALVQLREVGSLGEIDSQVRATSGASRLLALVALGLAPGIAEELLFRGLLQRMLRRRLGAGLAVGGAALAFAAVHADPVHSSAALVLGLYLGAIAELGGSVRPAMAAHVANNLLGVAALGLPDLAREASPAAAALLLGLGAAAMALVARSARR